MDKLYSYNTDQLSDLIDSASYSGMYVERKRVLDGIYSLKKDILQSSDNDDNKILFLSFLNILRVRLFPDTFVPITD